MIALALLLAIVPAMWLGQTALLLVARRPVRWRLDVHGTPPWVRTGCRATTQLVLVGAIVIYPVLLGQSPRDYYARFVPLDRTTWSALHGFLIAVLLLSLLYLAWNLAGCVTFSLRQHSRRVVRRLLFTPFSAALGAAAEELIFRAVLLAGLLASFPAGVAITLGACLFAAAHYVREVKRRWTFAGHVALGLLLCFAFHWTGTLWLPFGLHAGGIFAIMAARPFVRYEGPAWITGASIFPFAGVVGVAALAVLTVLVGLQYG